MKGQRQKVGGGGNRKQGRLSRQLEQARMNSQGIAREGIDKQAARAGSRGNRQGCASNRGSGQGCAGSQSRQQREQARMNGDGRTR